MDTIKAPEARAEALRLIDRINLIEKETDGFSRGELLETVLEAAEAIAALRSLPAGELPQAEATQAESWLRYIAAESERFSNGEILRELTDAQPVLRLMLTPAA